MKKLIFGTIIAFIIIISSIMAALSILEDEAVNNYLTISKLNAKSFSKELNQDLHNIENTIKHISSIIDLYNNDKNINQELKDILKSYPQIRSINVLKDKKIVYSSNKYNLEIIINENEFFPKTIFNEYILKVSIPWIGRDFVSGSSAYTQEEDAEKEQLSFIPISKIIDSKKGKFNVIVNLNSDYFINRFINNMNSENIVFELIRLDGVLLLTTENLNTVGTMIANQNLLDKTIEKSEYSGIETIDGTKYIFTYILTDDYPINLSVKLDYEKNLLSWNKKQYHFFIVTTIIVVLSILAALVFFILYNRKTEKEILLNKLQIQEQEKFKILFQDSHFMAAVINSDGTIVEINNKGLEFLGKTNKDLIDKPLWDLDCWKEKSKKDIIDLVTSYSNKKIEIELDAVDKNNNKRVLEFTLSSIDVEQKRLLVSVAIDITEKKLKEEKLKQAYTVFSNTRDGIMITDKNTNIIDVNKAFENITGYKKVEILNKKVNLLKSNVHDKKFYDEMWEKLNNNAYWEGEIVNINKDGNEFIEWLTINSIYDKNGEVINYIGVFSDISEQKFREKLLKDKDYVLYQQSKMAAMGEMIGNIAHQWRQPLSVISTAATGIIVQKQMDIIDEKAELKALTAINNSSQYLSQTIENFRNFLKIDKELKLFNLGDAIGEAISLSSIKIKSEEINLSLNLIELKVYGIKSEFIQVMINLLNNAKDAFYINKVESKYIFIDMYEEKENIYIKVRDNAGGIAKDIIDRIFEPYFTTKHQSQGTGIGLYMSLEIINNHLDGTLSVENEKFTLNNKEYIGACFTIKLPVKTF